MNERSTPVTVKLIALVILAVVTTVLLITVLAY